METLNFWFNAFIDISQVVVVRLSELPYPFVIVSLLTAVSGVFAVRCLLAWKAERTPPTRARYLRAMAFTVAAGMVLFMFQRLDLVLREIRELEYFVRISAVGNANARTKADSAGESRQLIDSARVKAGLGELFGEFTFETQPLNEAVEFASFRTVGSHPVTCYIAVIDLEDPRVEIKLNSEFGSKGLTSTFSLERDCIVAINGEAGMTPARNAPLGRWTGNWIVEGKAVLLEDSKSRPFLSFDRNNHATYSPSRTVDAELTDEKYNTLWGRKNLIVDGMYTPDRGPRWNRPSPRTLMGIDASGARLILAVIDGRQQGYSVGADLETSAGILKLFGAHNAMWCDQGGSTTMVLGCLKGVVNRPSDGHERGTYTHFGIAMSGTSERFISQAR